MKSCSAPPRVRNAAASCFVLGGLAIAGFAHSQVSEGQGSWSVKSPVPVARAELPAAVVNGKVYLLGGSARGVAYDMNRNDEYDPATDTWPGRALVPHGLNRRGRRRPNQKIPAGGRFAGAPPGQPKGCFLEIRPRH